MPALVAGLTGAAACVLTLAYFRRSRKTKRWAGWGTRKYVVMPHVSDESKRLAEEAQLRPSDVVVITFPKTGTTWVQQVCEQLRTGGDMSFDEITERQPWLEFAYDCGQDLNADQVANPRLFKSHQLLSAINPGAKYLSVMRDPEAVLLSWFSFQKAKGRPIFVDCPDANDYVRCGHFEGQNIFGTNIWEFYAECWEAREDPTVLVFCYEAMVRDLEAHLPPLAEFLGVPCDAGSAEQVVSTTSKSFMLNCVSKFDDHFIPERQKKFGRAKRVLEPAAKVTTGHSTVLTQETKEWLQRMWTERVLPRTGLRSYADMASALSTPKLQG